MTTDAFTAPAPPPAAPSGSPAGPVSSEPEQRGASGVHQLLVLTERQIRSMYGDRRLALFSLLQPLVMLLLLNEVFGSLADPAEFPHGTRYIDYLMPAILVTTGISSAQGAGVGLIRDLQSGIMARFRVLPTRLGLVLVARSVADLLRISSELLVLLSAGWLFFGFRPGGGVLGALAALALTLFVVWSLIWGFIALAAWLRNVEVMSGIVVFLVFPLTFASNAFVPISVLPQWLQVVARGNPISYAVDGARRLALGWPVGWSVPGAVLTGTVLGTACMVWAFRSFRRP